jgi:hypothetical protein
MTPAQEVDYILNDCFFAVGQAVGTQKSLDVDAIRWWRTTGTSWLRDRHRVTAVGRFLGQRALHHAGDRPSIDVHCATLASSDVETGCRMNAVREGVCTDSAGAAF